MSSGDSYMHIGVMVRFVCFHIGVIFEYVYPCWCHFWMCLFMLVSLWDLCIRVEILLGARIQVGVIV